MARHPDLRVRPSDAVVPPDTSIRVGIGGWTFAPWRTSFYPQGLAQKRELEYASRHVTAIEVNGTAYSPQRPETYVRWRDETPAGFVFSLKTPRFITQGRDLSKAGASIAAFIAGVEHLGDRLGPLLWQFPPTRAFEADAVAPFLELLPGTTSSGTPLRHALEVRHASFACADYVALARAHGVATVFTDSPEYPNLADVTGDFVYARLMRSRSEIASGYPDDELRAWAERVRRWARGGEPDNLPRVTPASAPAGRRDVFVYFISAAKERNPAAAQALLALLDADPR